MEPFLTVGISPCLLGEHVRYDGGHKRHRWIAQVLARFVEWVPVCPEVEMGLGVPRETLHLIRPHRMVFVRSGKDVTDKAVSTARRFMPAIARVDGYIFKRNSPSCGLFGVQVQGPRGGISRDGTGIFAAEVRKAFPRLPLTEEVFLDEWQGREAFFLAMLAHKDRRQPCLHPLIRRIIRSVIRQARNASTIDSRLFSKLACTLSMEFETVMRSRALRLPVRDGERWKRTLREIRHGDLRYSVACAQAARLFGEPGLDPFPKGWRS